MRLERPIPGPVTGAAHPRLPAPDGSYDFDVPVLIVPGLRDSPPAHWQTHWQRRIRGARRVVQCDSLTPDLEAWTLAVKAEIDACLVAPLVIAHGFGCFAVVTAATRGARIRAALLVAPADPERFGVDAALGGRLTFPTTLVASTDDPSLKLVRAAALATAWGSVMVPYRNAGHINAESGFGPWPHGFAHLDELLRRPVAGNSPGSLRLAS